MYKGFGVCLVVVIEVAAWGSRIFGTLLVQDDASR